MSTYRAVRDIEDALADGSVVVSDPAVLAQITAIEVNTDALTNALESNDADKFLVRLDKIGSTAVDVGNGSQGLGTQRVILADDQDPVAVTFAPVTVAAVEDPMGVGQKSTYGLMHLGGFRDEVPTFSGTGTAVGNGWVANQTAAYFTAGEAANIHIFSIAAADDNAGTGAQTVTWTSVDDAGIETTQTDDTNGPSFTATGTAAKVINSMFVATVGTGKTNVDIISLVENNAPGPTQIWARIATGEGVATGCNFKVKAAHNLHLVNISGHASEEITVHVECENHEGGEEILAVLLKIRVNGHFDIDLRNMDILDPLTQLRMTAWSEGTVGGLTCYMNGYVVPQI